MSTTNVQQQITGRQQQATCADEEQHGRTKADQHHQQQQQQCTRRRVSGVTATAASRSPVENSSQGRRCARCGGAFGRFYNTGASCPRCRHRVCRQCREFRGSAIANNKGDHSVDWLCAVCHKIAELHAATGEWIYETASLTSDRLLATKKNSPVDILKRSIRRAWTINGPPARWSVARKSPAFRIYRSLPLREKIYPSNDEVDVDDESFPLPKVVVTLTNNDNDNFLVSHTGIVEKNLDVDKCKGIDVKNDDCREETIAGNKELSDDSFLIRNSTRNERIDEKKLSQNLECVSSPEQTRTTKNERETSVDGTIETVAPRVSLIKPPRIITKLGTPEFKQGIKHGDRKSNIPIFRRSSREFEDIGSPQESAKRSLIPQRYRGSTDDLRRSREDISVPSLIPKLFSPRNRDQEKLKRQDSKDDVRQQLSKGNRRDAKDASKEETRFLNFSSSYTREEQKSGIRIFRRDSNSREDVGRETTSLPSLSVSRVKQTSKDEKHDRTEVTRVGETVTRSKSCPSEQGKTTLKALSRDDNKETINETKIAECKYSGHQNRRYAQSSNQYETIVDIKKMANEKTMIEERLDSPDARTVSSGDEASKITDKDNEEKEEDEDNANTMISSAENIDVSTEVIEPIIKSKEFIVDAANCSEIDFAGSISGEKKSPGDAVYSKRVDDMQVVRRKFSKEEFSNPDDTDETPNRRSSSHLSPEVSPLSTRSSRYSPRESESEPTPALPRKIGGGDSCTASQRIRDAITRTRRESNSSARYESSGSESVRLSESGLHGYADLARRVKLFGNGGNSPGPSPGSDEPVQRDSATSAGEDEPHEDCHSRGPGSSQGRTMLRRRRQFDAQGSRRRGRSHARSCCGEELQNLQGLHVIGRGGGRQPSPPQCQDTPNPDYRRLVFISSDSSSGREEDDADSSCSGSSYLNGLPRNNNHAQSLEDCDWDYFESGTLPLPGGLTDGTTNIGHVGVDSCLPQDWSCCPGRGSAACLACGGSPGANVLPVPVPIPVPVPYPVPVPASLWTGDFAAAASSMITRGAAPEGTLRLRGDPSAPWFSWHPRFNKPLHGARIDPRSTIGAFDPSTFGFTPEEITPRFYNSPAVEEQSLDSSPIVPPTEPAAVAVDTTIHFDENKDAVSMSPKSREPEVESRDTENLNESIDDSSNKDSPAPEPDIVPEVEESPTNENEENIEPVTNDNNSEAEDSNDDTEDSSQESTSSRDNSRMFRHSRENSGSSSGRSSADSSDLEDSATHRFSRVFVVNDDSLTSDNDIEDNEDSDEMREGGGVVTLKRVTSLPEEEPVVLRRVRLLDEDMNLQRDPGDPENQVERSADRRLNRIERRIDLLAERDPDANEIYLASSTDFSDSHIQLKSIKNLNPDSIEMANYRQSNENGNSQDLDDSPKNWDSVITPDSLEVVATSYLDNSIEESLEANILDKQTNDSISSDKKIEPMAPTKIDNIFTAQQDYKIPLSSSVDEALTSAADRSEISDLVTESSTSKNTLANSNSCSTMDSSETNTTCSEVSSDELHEYEVSPYANGVPVECSTPRDEKKLSNSPITKRKLTPMPRRILRLENPSETSVSAAKKSPAQLPCVAPRTLKFLDAPKDISDETACGKNKSIEPNDTSSRNVGELISSKIHDIFKSVDRVDNDTAIDDENCEDSSRVTSEFASSRIVDSSGAVRGEKPGVSQVGVSGEVVAGGNVSSGGSDGESTERGKATARFRSVERRPPTRKENGCFPPTATSSSSSFKEQTNESQNFPSNNNNKYRSLVMITQGSYQPVSVITSDTTTLLQPPNETQSTQGLAGYFHLALEAVSEPHQRNGPRRPLMVKRLGTATTEQEADSGLSVGGSASESDDVQSVKSFTKISAQQQQPGDQQSVPKTSAERSSLSNNNNINNNEQQQQQQQISRVRVANSSPQSSDDNSVGSGVVILEEGLADDDSWVEEVSHDEDEQSATTATEESSEDETNNLGDREEELRGYHRQAIDFTLHTIVEESCEESEAEPSLAAGSPRKKQRPPSASELEKYFFFGLGGDNSGASMGSREVDSLSETSSIYSEGLESLGQEEASPTAGQENNKGSNEFLNSSRLEKYFLSEFLGFDQDRRDSDGSVGSDSEGRPSPEAQRRKRLVRARGTGRSSHSSSLDNLLALAQGSQNLSSQNSLQDLSLAQDSQETQSEGSSTETDGAEDGQTPAFGTDGQFDTVKRKKKKPRTLGTQSPRVAEDRNKTPEPRDIMVSELPENEGETINSEDDRAKTPQPESALHSSSSSSSQIDGARGGSQASSSDTGSSRSKQQSRDSGFVGSCDDLLQHQKSSNDGQSHHEGNSDITKDHSRSERNRGIHGIDAEKKRSGKSELLQAQGNLQPPPNASLSRKDSFNNWSSDEETNLMMSKMRQFFKTMVANSNGQAPASNSSGPSPAPSPRLSGYSKARMCSQNRTKPPQLVYFENELTRLMKTVPGIRDEQVREIVEYLSSEDTWSDSYDSSDYTSSDLEGAAGGRRSALQEQISQSCQQIINKFDTNSSDAMTPDKGREEKAPSTPQPCLGRDTAFVYQKLVQSFTKIAGDGPSSDTNSTPHSSPPLIAKVMHHIGSRLVALMHEVSEGGSTVQPHSTWRRYSQHHRTPSSASTTEDDDSTSDSTNTPSSSHLPRSKSHDPLLLINGHPATTSGQEGEEREASDYERFSWRGSFESALMAADSRTKLSLLACSGDVSASASASALAMAAKRRSAGDLLFNPKSFSREQLDRVRSCGSIGGGSGGGGSVSGAGGSIEEKIWSNRRRSSVPDANTRGESGASAGDEDTEDELEYGSDPRATTLPRGMQAAAAASAATNSLPRLPASTTPGTAAVSSTTPMHKAHSVYHFLPQHTGVKSARYRPPGFARNSLGNAGGTGGPKRAVSAPGLQVTGSQVQSGKRETSRSRRQQTISLTPDDGSSLSEACSTPIIGAGTRAGSSHTVMDIDDMDRGLHSGHLATRASLSSLGARSDSMASVYSGAGEGRWCGSVAVRGEVEFSLQYDYKQLTFEVHVTQCKDLAPVDIKRNRSDPYVKVYLLPDKSKSGKRKTKVKKHTLNPVFDETLKFHMSLNGLETRTLWLTVWHSDMFGRNDFLGEVRMPLENKIFDDPTPRWYPLQERTEPFDDPISYKGEVIVGLKFVPPDPAQLERDRETSTEQRGISKGRKNWSRGSLHVLVKEARNLQTRAKNSGTCDPFCKSYLLPDKGRSGKQKTGVVRRSGGSPVWGHTFVYKDVSLQELAERGLELTVWDHDRIGSNEFLGGVRFNLGNGKHYGKVVDWMDATGRELSLWQSMIERPNFWVEGAVTLRPNLHNHGKSSGT